MEKKLAPRIGRTWGSGDRALSLLLTFRIPGSPVRWLNRAFITLVLMSLGSGLHLSFQGGVPSVGLSAARADNIQYVYDELGRLVQASDLTSGQAVVYTYDAVGNITSQTATSLNALSIGYFSPQTGPVGTQVSISGTGFSATAAANTVNFNGVTATVVTASQTQLVVTVPAGTTTGPISVQVGTASATSSTPFTLTPFGNGPTITSLYPIMGSAGSTVTITGTGFQAAPLDNSVQFNDSFATVGVTTATTITTLVPANTGSGKVQVTTPYGVAISPMDFIVIPSGYSAGSIGSTGRLPTDGSSTSLTLPKASQVSVQLFNGNEGDLLTLGVSGMSLASATIKVFNPDGSSLTTGTVTASGQGVQLPALPRSGTYTIVVDPGSNTGNIALSVVKPSQGTLTLNGTPTQVTLSPPGQRAFLSFSGTQGTYANLALSGVTLSAGAVSLIAPDGGVVDSRNFTTSGTALQPQLPATGLYQVLINPTGSVGGALTVALTTSSSPALTVNGGSMGLTLTNTTPVPVTFEAAAGQYLALAASVTQSTITSFSLSVVGPDGTQLASGTLNTSFGNTGYAGSTVVNLGPLPMGGTYTLLAQANSSGSGPLTLTLSTPAIATLAADGTSSGTAISTPGQGLLYTATATAGQYLNFALVESISNPGRINAASITVLRPDGSQLTTGALSTAFLTCSGGGTCLGASGYYGSVVLNVGPAPESGTYTFLVQQTGAGSLDTGTLSATLSTPQNATLSANAATSNANISSPGQGLQYSFSGLAGQYMALSVAESQGQINSAVIAVLAPDGSLLSTGALVTTSAGSGTFSGSTVLNMGPLPTTGNYSVYVLQSGTSTGAATGSLSVTLTTPLTGALATSGATANPAITLPGQGLQYTFAGTAGQYLSVGLAENVDQITSATVTILNPDGSLLANGNLTTATVYNALAGIAGYSGSVVMNIGPLLASGTYTILVQQIGGGGAANTGTLSLTLSGPVTGTLAANGGTSNVNASMSGQGIEYSFAGAAGQFVAATVLESVDQIKGATVSILNPNGLVLTTGSLTTTAVPNALSGIAGYSGGVVLNAGPLPAAGTYSVLVQQTGTGGPNTGTLSLTLSSPVTGAVPVGGSTSVPVLLPGQGVQQTFTASAGELLTVQVAESYGSNISSAAVTVFNPDGTRLKQQAMNATTCSTCNGYAGTTTFDLGSVPQSGTYSVLAQQTTMATNGTGALTVAVAQLSPAAGQSGSYSTSTAGQSSSFTFSGEADQSMSLALTNLVLTPVGSGYVTVNIYAPDGTYVTGTYCYPSSPGCEIILRNLTQTGAYNVTVTPGSSNQQMSFTVAVLPDVTGTLAVGTPSNVSLPVAGQVGLFTFTATAGQNLALDVSGITTVPASTYVTLTIYNSAGNQVTSATVQSATTFNLQSLAADTYTVWVMPQYPATTSLQLTLGSGTIGTVPGNDTSASFSTAVPGQDAYFTFSGTAGSMSLALTNLVLTPVGSGYVTVNIYAPDGTYVYGTYCYPSSPGCEMILRNLTQTGAYNATVTPGSSNQQMSFTVSAVPDVTGTLAVGTAANVSLPVAGQIGLFTFAAVSGQTLALDIGGITTVPASTYVTLTIYNSAGNQVTSTTVQSASTFNLPSLAADTYTVWVTPQYPATTSLQMTLEPGTTGTVPGNETAASFSTPAPGQDAYFTFSGVAGQSMSLALTNLVLTPVGSGYVTVNIYAPDGTYVTGTYCYPSSPGCEIILRNLTQTGTYNATVTPGSSNQQMSFTVSAVPDVTGTLAVSTPANVSLPVAGQIGVFTFTATAGQILALDISGITTVPASTYMTLTIYNSAGSTVASTTVQSGSTFNLPNLAADTYTVWVTPQYPVTGTLQITLEPGTTGTVPGNETAASFSTPAPGQDAYFSFSGTAGQSMSLALMNLVLTPVASGYITVNIYAPDGTYVNGTYCYPSSPGCEIILRNLTQTGVYNATVTPGSSNQQMSFTVTAVPDVTGMLAVGTPSNVSLPVAGQMGLFTFTATAGQTLALDVSGITTTPANTYVTVNVYNSAGSQVASTTVQTTTTFNLPNLAAGTYTVWLMPQYPVTGTLQITLEPGTTGTVPGNGTATSFSTPAPGQDAYFSFSGAAGQSMSLALMNLVLTPVASGYITVNIYAPDGTYVNGTYCYPSSPGCEIILRNLTQTGVYNATVTPGSSNQQMSFTLASSTDVTGSLSQGSPLAVSLGSVGQSAVLTFTATAGETVALTVSGVSATPANTSFNITVFNSAGSQVGSTSTATGTTQSLANLAAGTYQVFVTPQYPATASMQVGYQ
jgi:YD repeat-containing protein